MPTTLLCRLFRSAALGFALLCILGSTCVSQAKEPRNQVPIRTEVDPPAQKNDVQNPPQGFNEQFFRNHRHRAGRKAASSRRGLFDPTTAFRCSMPFISQLQKTLPTNPKEVDYSDPNMCPQLRADCFPQQKPKQTGNQTCLPEIFLIGAPKAATSSLFAFLGTQPSFCSPSVKEPNYFINRDDGFNHNIKPRGKDNVAMIREWDDYMSIFDSCRKNDNGACHTGEASTIYMSCPSVATHIKNEIQPKTPVRIVAILRNPVERYLSHYSMISEWVRLSKLEPKNAPFAHPRVVHQPLFRQVQFDLHWIGKNNFLRRDPFNLSSLHSLDDFLQLAPLIGVEETPHKSDLEPKKGRPDIIRDEGKPTAILDAQKSCKVDRMQNNPHHYALLEKGAYADLLLPWFEAFGSENVMLVKFEDLIHESFQSCLLHRILQFLGLEEPSAPVRSDWKLPHENTSSKKASDRKAQTSDDRASQALRVFYAPLNRRLKHLFGRDWGWD